jgi:hypothetical protein
MVAGSGQTLCGQRVPGDSASNVVATLADKYEDEGMEPGAAIRRASAEMHEQQAERRRREGRSVEREPRCPDCGWRLKIRASYRSGWRWWAFCWNPHCPERDAGETEVSARRYAEHEASVRESIRTDGG